MYFRNDNYLMHYGVKGMKWGVRKDDGSYILPKGTKVYRLSIKQKSRLKNRPTYFYTDADKDVYEGAFATFLKYNVWGKGGVYKKTYITTQDLRAPSDKKAYDITVNRIKNDKKVAWKVANYGERLIQNKHPIYEMAKKSSFKNPKDQKTWTNQEKKKFNEVLAFGAYNLMVEHDKKELNKYIKEIKKVGYNSVMDYNNKGIYNKAVEPFIAANAKKTLKQIDQEELEDKYIDATIKKLWKKIGRKPVL